MELFTSFGGLLLLSICFLLLLISVFIGKCEACYNMDDDNHSHDHAICGHHEYDIVPSEEERSEKRENLREKKLHVSEWYKDLR